MSNGNRHDIYERIFNFIVLALKFTDRLPKTYSNQVIIGQLTRSVTSMGANSQEADGTSTKKDFLHCFTIVRKEGKETVYWLRLIEKLNSRSSEEVLLIVKEGIEIVAIVSAIIKNTLNNPKQS
jgi:four helix bundle protein